MEVYTDGACLYNGQPEASAGIGVFWGDGHYRNVSAVVRGDKHTNQVAEIQAAIAAIRIANRERFYDLIIYTDSKYVFNAATDWIDNKWKLQGWRNSQGEILANKKDFKKLDKIRNKYERSFGEIEWIHVHCDGGIYGNMEADRLAKQAAQRRLDAILYY